MTFSSMQFAANTLATLRAAEFSRLVESDEHIVPELYFNWDTEEGEVQVDVVSTPGELIQITAQIHRIPRWFSLNISLGPDKFAPDDVIGMAVDLQADQDISLSPFIRTSESKELFDTDLDEPLHATTVRQVTTLLHTVASGGGLGWVSGYHTAVLRLPLHNFQLRLSDLRFFALPKGQVQHLQDRTLAKAAL
jgi:hypothetical protein